MHHQGLREANEQQDLPESGPPPPAALIMPVALQSTPGVRMAYKREDPPINNRTRIVRHDERPPRDSRPHKLCSELLVVPIER